jgi:hypothetical protein
MDPTKLKPESYAVAKWGSRFAAVGINPAHHAGLPEAMASENGLATNGRRFRIPTGGSALPNRGLLAPLSPHEEVTLRRVAIGIAKPADLPARDVERLKALMLVEQNGDGLQLTPVVGSAISPFRTAPASLSPTLIWLQRWPSLSRKDVASQAKVKA